jgi:hypothetical protein
MSKSAQALYYPQDVAPFIFFIKKFENENEPK